MNKKQKKILIRIIISAALLIILHFIPVSGIPRFLLYLIPYGVIGYDILKKAWKGILNRQVFDENFLMAVATLGALALGLLKTGDYEEAVAVMLFYQIGELFQSYAVGKSRRNISELMDIRPDYANIEDADGNLTRVDPDEVAIGTVIVINPGEKVPLDGIVENGKSSLNTSALTGESVPRGPPSARSSTWWKTPAPGSRSPRTSSPASPAGIRPWWSAARWRWLYCRRWSACSCPFRRNGASGSTAP